MAKSLTQKTKAELIQTVYEKNVLIAELNAKIDELERMAIASTATPVSADVSALLSQMNERIKALEEQVNQSK